MLSCSNRQVFELECLSTELSGVQSPTVSRATMQSLILITSFKPHFLHPLNVVESKANHGSSIVVHVRKVNKANTFQYAEMG